MRIFLCLTLIILPALSVCSADTFDTNVKGLIEIGAGKLKGDYKFVSISWVSVSTGTFVDTEGQSTTFSSDLVTHLVYFDSKFAKKVHKDNFGFLADVQSVEVVTPMTYDRLLTSSDLNQVQQSRYTLDSLNLPQTKPYIDHLDSLIAAYNGGQRIVDNKWVSKDEVPLPDQPRAPAVPSSQVVTFTTLSGTNYSSAQVTVSDVGLAVTSSSGGTTVPFDDLPDDLSVFPIPLQDQIRHYGKLSKANAICTRVNEIISPMGDQLSNSDINPTVFTLTSSDNTNWTFNINTLALDGAKFESRTITRKSTESIDYSHTRVAVYADDDSAFGVGDNTTMHATRKDEVSTTICYLMLKTKGKVSIATTALGDDQKHEVIFCSETRHESEEILNLFNSLADRPTPSEQIEVTPTPSPTPVPIPTHISIPTQERPAIIN